MAKTTYNSNEFNIYKCFITRNTVTFNKFFLAKTEAEAILLAMNWNVPDFGHGFGLERQEIEVTIELIKKAEKESEK